MRVKWFNLVRIFGMLLVLVYHFFKDIAPGGFFGVDIMFTISGYLITSLIIEEVRRSGSFNLLAFYKRRVVRIFPPLLLAMIFTLPFALLISPDFTGGIARQAAGALGFVTNYVEIFGGGSYEAQLLPHLYVHTWSLAMEMHYYLLWGLAALVAVLVVTRAVKDEARRGRALKISLGLLALVLGGLCWWNMQRLFASSTGDPSAAYFSSTSHAFPFFVGSAAGALLGMQISEKTRLRMQGKAGFWGSILTMVLAGGGIAAMAVLFQFNQQRTYRFGFLLASVLSVVLLYAARTLHEATPKLRREPRVITFFADISYGVYLFHWPLYIVFSNALAQHWLAVLLTMALSIGFSSLIFYGVEPFLRGKRPWEKRPQLRKVFYPVLAVLVLLGTAGSIRVFLRAPAITGLELPIMIGNVYQDAESAAVLQKKAAAVQAEPIKNRSKALTYGDASDNPGRMPDDEPWAPAVDIPETPGGISFLGDSVSLGADRLLKQTLPNARVDSAVSRSLSSGDDILKEWMDDGDLREIVIVSLGTNGYSDYKKHVDNIVEAIPEGHRLIFVTPFIAKSKQGYFHKEISEYYRTLANTLPYVTVADWAKEIAAQKSLLAADGIHFGNVKKASQLYVDTLLKSIAAAAEKPAK